MKELKNLKNNEIMNVTGSLCDCYCYDFAIYSGSGEPIDVHLNRGKMDPKQCQALCLNIGFNKYRCDELVTKKPSTTSQGPTTSSGSSGLLSGFCSIQ